ncbi:MAG: nucleotidyltransferase domain-containing protein [Deltaproteobacteria bacterium]|nr:nucleotidyltransferase domain-containing protein [Deltaproteobacteria bacterium]MBW1940374.1 nucleotidyltransferase domain-containing protein [Deltaproteobacteria bacterium]MBW2100752.1 nucleotidyltransferase domain-containing protein [Deltaproteobacteria bacterium]
MTVSNHQKELIKSQIREKLSKEQEIQKIVLFGSFVNSNNPNDIDIAIFQNSNEKYLSLSLKYRKLVRDISKILPIDVIPLKINAKGTFLNEIESGEIIYER